VITLVDVFVPGRLTNPLNGPHRHWSQRARWAKEWRTRVVIHVGAALGQRGRRLPAPERPKRITFGANTGRTWDDDNLRAGLKPVRDGLIAAHVIDDDGNPQHEFIYRQEVDRGRPGVRIVVEEK
jgi:hypothetical protein